MHMMMAKIMLNTVKKKWTTHIYLNIGVWLTKLLH